MTRTKSTYLALIVLLSPMAANADPIVLDFDGGSGWIDLDLAGIDSIWAEDGFIVDGTGSSNAMGIGTGGYWCSPVCPDNGTEALRVQNGGGFDTVVSISRDGGGTFDVSGFDGAEFFLDLSSTWASTIRLTGTYSGGGTVIEDFSLDFIHDGLGGLADFQSFTVGLDFSGLTELSISGYGGSNSNFSFDNLRLETTTVPEPGTLALFGIGLLGMGAARRSKKA